MTARCSLLLLLPLVGCSDYDLSVAAEANGSGLAAIGVDPTVLVFADLRTGQTARQEVVISSIGEATLFVTDVRAEGPAFDVELWTGFLEPGESVSVEVSFSPTTPGSLEGQLTVSSDDVERPEVPVELYGTAVGPRLQVDPLEHDFGPIPVPCSASIPVTLTNVGNADLRLDEVVLDGSGFVVSGTPDLPRVLAPGGAVQLELEATAAGDLTQEATLFADSDDPAGPQTARFSATPTVGAPVEETFIVPDDLPTDLLFAVDQSASMDDDAERLGANFGQLVETLAEVTTGWHIGVVTYDHGCFNGGVLTATTDGLDAEFEAAVSAGTDDEIRDDERLFQLVDRALTQDTPGGCNDGFRRTGAPLQVIVVSDEPERSAEESPGWTWDHWVDRFVAVVGAADLLTVSGVVDRDGCAAGDAGYAEAIAATGGEALSICGADWAEHAVALAEAALAGPWAFELVGTPVEGTVSVQVDGEVLTDGLWFDAASNHVVLDTATAGSVLTVSYSVAETCD
ncbi:MAG: hypothetical protein ACI8PZ_006737 [Myxococcota bacterium]|jgi:hypothetical protein